MNLERFIAKRVAASNKRSFSGLIIKIAIAAVALSLAIMIITSAVIAGFKNQISEKIFGFWGHIHITSTYINRTTGEAVPLDVNQSFYPSLTDIDKIGYYENASLFGYELPFEIEKETKGGVRHIQTFCLIPGIIKTKKEIEGIVLKGIADDFDWTFFERYLIDGERIAPSDSSSQRGIILSKQTADRLQLKVGDRFNFNYIKNKEALQRRFTVHGIYKTGLEEYDRKFALVNINQLQQLLGWQPDQVSGFEVFIDDLSDLEVLSDHIYIEEIPGEMYAESIRSKYPAIFEWLALQNINEVVIIILMLIVGLINMITALLILILERTNMIGIMKALGQTDWGIRKTFLYHAGMIIASGLLWGNLLGIGFCVLQKYTGIIQLSEENYYLSTAPVELNIWTILLLNAGAMLMIMLFLIIPSWLVTKISPVKAIRFK
ncbi:MAG: FtsX-like permease family protein [Bacteroidota bacterium]